MSRIRDSVIVLRRRLSRMRDKQGGSPFIILRAGTITCKGFRQLLEAWTNDGSPHEYRAGVNDVF